MRSLLGAPSPFTRAPSPTSKPPANVVYFIRLGDRIKIGTTGDLASRLSSLPYEEVLLTEPGSYELERQRHWQFNRHLAAGREWFYAHPDLLAWIDERKRQTA